MTAIVASGMLAGFGLALLALWLAPAQPELASAIDRLDPQRVTATDQMLDPGDGSAITRLGIWVQRRIPARWLRVPASDLNVLGVPTATFLGKKMTLLLIGMAFPTLASAVAAAGGMTPPFQVPVLAGLLLGPVLFFAPDLETQRKAAAARIEFTRELTSYIDLVALERSAGGGASQALEVAAQVGDSWVFGRLREELAQARWSGKPSWEALSHLSDELGVPTLHDLGDIMRLSGEEGVGVYDALRARAAASRSALLAADHTQANRISETLAFPISAIALSFLAILVTPALLRIALGG